jgi:uncharacterized membrane protein (UPF0127 family)
MKKYLILALFCLAVVLILLQGGKKESYAEIGGQRLSVDVATTGKDKSRGLSGRESLASNEGMLFVFENPGQYPFWMKDMNFPIDIIWIGEDLRVVYVKNNATPESYPEAFGPSGSAGSAKYVLEVAAGFSDKNNLKIGDSAVLEY